MTNRKITMFACLILAVTLIVYALVNSAIDGDERAMRLARGSSDRPGLEQGIAVEKMTEEQFERKDDYERKDDE